MGHSSSKISPGDQLYVYFTPDPDLKRLYQESRRWKNEPTGYGIGMTMVVLGVSEGKIDVIFPGFGATRYGLLPSGSIYRFNVKGKKLYDGEYYAGEIQRIEPVSENYIPITSMTDLPSDRIVTFGYLNGKNYNLFNGRVWLPNSDSTGPTWLVILHGGRVVKLGFGKDYQPIIDDVPYHLLTGIYIY
jgi:hypothetical protein